MSDETRQKQNTDDDRNQIRRRKIMAYRSTNPYTGEVVAEFNNTTNEEVEAKLQKAQKAYESWSKTSFEERAAVMKRAAQLARERRDELAAINTIETGKLVTIAAWEMNLCADIMDYYADNAKELLKPHYIKTSDQMAGDAVGIYQPLGIIYMVEPWNVPFFQMTRPSAAQLMAGNVVVLKHASNCPQCALAMEKLYKDAGLPDGCFTNLFIDYDQSNALIADKRICGITLTGSTPVGRSIAAESGRNLKKCVMELGGSDAMVVMPDADFQKAVQGALMGRMTISGQVCAGDKRMFIHESIYDQFKAAVAGAIDQLKIGDPLNPETTLAPVCSKKAADKIRSQIAKAVENGATATEIGPKVPADSAWVQPTILTGVTPENPIFNEEIFGPVLMLFSWKTEDEVIALANGTDFGLGSSVYSEDPVNAARMAAAMESGAVSINQPTMAAAAIPFGGVKTSGFGRELGADGIREFTNQKYINSAGIDMKKVFEQY
jgi:succinate-semialdehyde dehydrogenase/glutarate-semialdehyde dehydrogenase